MVTTAGKLVVTGGAGFLGYHLCRAAIGRYREIVVLDLEPIDPAEYPSPIRFERGDIRDPGRLAAVFSGAEAVVHAAAALPLWKKSDIREINVDGTRNVLEIAQRLGIQRVVHISSTAVYGIPKKHPILESDPLQGIGPYGESKLVAERLCEDYRAKGLVVPVIRPTTFIGQGRLGVFQILFDWIESGKKIPVIGRGDNRYQLLEVEDLVQAIHLCLVSSPAQANHTFNVGAEQFGTIREDLEALFRFAQTGARVLPTPAGPVKAALAVLNHLRLSPLYPWVYATVDKDSFVSTDRIRGHLGWQPQYSNTDALIRAYRWYLEYKPELQLAHAGVTHRVPWKQGALGLVKRLL